MGGIGLPIIERCKRARAAAESRMGRNVRDALAADIDDAAIAQACDKIATGLQHRACPPAWVSITLAAAAIKAPTLDMRSR